MPLTRAEFETEITSRKILYFSCDVLNTREPHYFICICIHPFGEINFSCCTSQFETVKRLIERHRYPPSTLVYISPADTDNPFDRDTYVNCNEYFTYDIEELWQMYTNGEIIRMFDNPLPLHSFEQIVIGFRDSEMIEEDFKDALPGIDDF
jgi:hypothetical protein